MYIYSKFNIYSQFVGTFNKIQIYTYKKFIGSFLKSKVYICKIKSICKVCRQLPKISNVYICKVHWQLLKIVYIYNSDVYIFKVHRQLLKNPRFIFSKSNIYAKFVGSLQKLKFIYMQSVQVASKKRNAYIYQIKYIRKVCWQIKKKRKCIHKQIQVASKKNKGIYICKIKYMWEVCRQLPENTNAYMCKVHRQLLKNQMQVYAKSNIDAPFVSSSQKWRE